MTSGRVIAALLLAATPATAQTRPETRGGDPHLQVVEYRPDQVVLIETAPGYQVTIELASDDPIQSVGLGDNASWSAVPNRAGSHLFVKALSPNATTNMTVITANRLYAFDLQTLPGPHPSMPYAVQFRYARPDEEPPPAPDGVEGRYRLGGQRALRPSAISDNGVQTFIEWPPDAMLPAVYAQDHRGRDTLVNGVMRGGQYVIDGVSRRLTFRLDDRVASAERVAAEQGR